MLRIERGFAVLSVVFCALTLASCGGKHTYLGDLGGEETALAPPLEALSGLPPFPTDDEDPGDDMVRTTSAVTVKRKEGAAFQLAECYAIEYGLTHPGTQQTYDALGVWSMYSPYINYPNIPVNFGFALYKRPNIGTNNPPADFRQLVIEATPAYAADYPFPDDWIFPKPEYYVALANWDQHSWQFIGGPYGELPEASIDLTSLGFTYLSPQHGHLFYLLVVPASHNMLVHNSYVVLGDDTDPPPPAPTNEKVNAKTHDFYRAFRKYLIGTKLGLSGARSGQWGIEEYGSDTAYAMYYRSRNWFKNKIGDPANLQGIEIHASPEMPPPFENDEYWFALPNFDTGAWEYFGPLNDYPLATVDLSGVNFNFLSPLGNFYYMILAKEMNGVVIDWAKFLVDTTPAGPEWLMFGHDPQRTGRSDFNGPAANGVKWIFDPGADNSWTSPVIGPDGTVYTTTMSGGSPTTQRGSTLWAINPSDGSVKWSFFRDWTHTYWGTPAVGSNGHIYAGVQVFTDGYIYSWLPDGTLKWTVISTYLGPIRSSAVRTDSGEIYVTTMSNKLLQILEQETSPGSWSAWINWEYTVPEIAPDISPAVAPDGTVYIGGFEPVNTASGAFIYAVNPNGTLKWKSNVTMFPNSTFTSAPTVGTDGTIYVGVNCNKPPTDMCGPWGEMIALNPTDGSVKWRYECDHGGHGPWVTPIPCFIFGSPSLDQNGDVWFGTEDDNLLGLDGATGALVWEHPLNDVVHSSAAIGGDGRIYLGDDSGHVYCVEPGAGGATSEIWSYGTGDVVKSSPAIGSNGCLYFTTLDGRLFAIGT